MKYPAPLVVIFLIFAAFSICLAAPGDLDISFASRGYVRAGFGSGNDWGYCTAVQPDGKLLVAGMSTDGQGYESSLLRYNSDGSPDTSFNGSGKIITSLGTYGSRIYAIAVQPDGKIVTAGAVAYNGPSPFANFWDDILIVRYNPDGSLDKTFDGDGKVVTAAGYSSIALALRIQSDGKIVVTGSGVPVGSNSLLIVVRYNPNGTPDLTFDDDGVAFSALGQAGEGIDVQADGKVVVTGYKNNFTDFVTLRFNVNGSWDTSFNNTGEAPLPPGGANDRAHAVAVQADGKIVVTGLWGSTEAGGGSLALIRYNTDGSFDKTFGDNGFRDTGLPGSARIKLLIQPNGKIVVNTMGFDGSQASFKAARFDSDGSPDTTFNGTGVASMPVGNQGWTAGVALSADGGISVTGYIFTSEGYEFAAVRFAADGSADKSFGSDGMVVNDIGNIRASAARVRLQPDGKMVACGSRGITSTKLVVARYSADGMPDASFSDDGWALLEVGDNTTDCADLAIHADGRITVAGTASAGNRKVFFAARFNPDGSPDVNFGAGGHVTTAIGSNDAAVGLALQPDGKIVVAGTTGPTGASTDIAVARYNPDGSLDSTFDGDGKLITIFDVSPQRIVTTARAVAVQDDGRIVVTGLGGPPNQFTYIPVARYQPDGSLDRSFNRTGKLLIPVGNGGGYDLRIRDDGKLVIAGQCVQGNSPVTCLLRLETGGHPDLTFNGTGKVTVNHGPGNSNAVSLALRPDGKMIVGAFASDSHNRNFATLRVNEDGSLDPAWGFNGITSISLGEYDSFGSLAVDPLGQVILAGQRGDLLALARLQGDLATTSFAVVTGRVLDTNWQPVNRATVSMTDPSGSVRTAQTNPFGYYRFEDVRVGEAYTFLAKSKRLRFTPRLVTVAGDLNGVDLIAY